MPEIGATGQKKIQSASILCVGAGGLGSPAALYLAAAGVGRIGIVDCDEVEISNLQRQILHGMADLGRPKAVSAGESIQFLNPDVKVEAHQTRLSGANAMDLFRSYDIVVDGSDNFTTRFLANDAAVLLKKAYIYGSVLKFEGQASVFAPHLGGPCYRCLYPEPPPPGSVPSCVEAGVLGVVPGIIGVIQATEALKLILGVGKSLMGRLLLLNALDMKFREIKVRRDPKCALCGARPTLTELKEVVPVCPVATVGDVSTDEVSVQELQRVLADPASGIRVIDVREPDEHAISRIEGVALLPLSALPQRFKELDPGKPLYIFCKGGHRSQQACYFLKRQGFSNVKSVKGGILAWSVQVDPSVPRY